MATPTIIKQSLDLSKALIIGTGTVTDSDKEQMIALAQEILNLLQGLKSPPSNEKALTVKTPEVHPVDALLKKGKS
jgi:hypothetical protein